MKKLLLVVVAATVLAALPLSAALAGVFTLTIPKTHLMVSQVGDIDVNVSIDEEGKVIQFKVDDREYSGTGVEVSLMGHTFWADCLTVVSNLDSTEDLMAEHDGTITLLTSHGEIVLEYDGEASVMHGKGMKHMVIIKSHGDFKVTDVADHFEELKGVEGTYMMTIVETGIDVGSKVGFKFSAEEIVEAEEIED